MKRIFSIVILTCATVMLSAQKPKSFVVTDKEGNSPLVESLIFQKDASDEKFSWKTSTESDGYQAGRDIRNLKFIARTNAELQTADSEDIITKLNAESGTNGVDAEAIAVTLKDNPNVKEAFTDDGGNLVVKLEKEDENYNVFPMYGIDDVFSENGESYLPASLSPRQPEMFKASANSGKVAIFNFFSGDNSVKNRLVNKLTEIFRKQHYTVDVYSRHSGSSGSINEFTVDKLNEVISHSSEYSFILIFSHGFVIDGKSYFATGEISKSLTTNYPKPTHFMWVDNMKYITYPASFEVANKECLVYLGSCYGGNYLSTNANKSIIAWKGRNSIAQTHATVIFDKMFSDIWCNISNALESSFKKDPFSPEAAMVVADDAYSGTSYYPDIDTEYMEDAIMDLTNKTTSSQNKGEKGDIFVKKKDFQQVLKLGGTITGEKVGEYFLWVRVKLDPVIQFGGSWTPDPIYVNFKKDNINPNDNVDYVMEDFWVKLPADTPEGIYRVVVQSPTYEGGLKFRETIRQRQPMYIIYSSKLSDNYALPAYSEEDLQFPEIQDANGARVEEMEVAAGASKEFTIYGYPGHTFYPTVMNSNIAQLSIDGNRLTVTGVSEGKTYARVTDLNNKLFFIFDVTVTDGTDMSPGEAIDLGLPSGTLWASCNVGATKPEEYGLYFAWGETKGYTIETNDFYTSDGHSFDWANYKWCNGDYNKLTKYCYDSSLGNFGNNGFTDNKTELDLEDDAAYVNWGSSWRMPSLDQIKELIDNCNWEWTQLNGVYGRKVTGPNGKSIFLPAAGYRYDTYFEYIDSHPYGRYWSRTLLSANYPDGAETLRFAPSEWGWLVGVNRCEGQSVRPVCR